MRLFAENLWIEERPLNFYGMPFGTRMSVIILHDGDLFIHSPVALTQELRLEIEALGQVRHIVSPNKLHHLYLGEWQTAYPDARIYASPGLRKKRRDLNFTSDLGNLANNAWAEEIDQLIFGGSFVMQEVVFFHRRSRTLLLADLLEHFCEDQPFFMRLLMRIFGMYKRAITPTDWRMTFWQKKKARLALAQILAWQPEKIILAHGRLIEENADSILRNAFSWLTPSK